MSVLGLGISSREGDEETRLSGDGEPRGDSLDGVLEKLRWTEPLVLACEEDAGGGLDARGGPCALSAGAGQPLPKSTEDKTLLFASTFVTGCVF